MAGNYATEREGIATVQAGDAERGQIRREASIGDFGIDGHSEFVDENSEPNRPERKSNILGGYTAGVLDRKSGEQQDDRPEAKQLQFIAPLSPRGGALKDLISKQEDDLVNSGILQPNCYRAAQEAFVEMVEVSLFPRFERVAEVAESLQTWEPSDPPNTSAALANLKRMLYR